ncbi:MAG: nitroreductase family protein [Eubacteriales bacterium]|nr:nitroreductase family protein [Eubacteriales bacterium]
MSFFELAHERYSVRKFSDRPVEQEKLEHILEAGRVAPTAVNYQPQRILVLRGDGMERLKKCTRMTFGAPMALVIGYDKLESWKDPQGKDNGDIDASIVASHIMFTAWEEGIGATWTGHYNKAALVEEFDLPEYFEPTVILPMGYPAEDCEPHPVLHSSRKSMEETVYYDSFEGMNPGIDHKGKH